jgi:uncharacterized membrane protein
MLLARIFSGPIMALLGLNHFLMPRTYEKIIPDSLPGPLLLVYVSGVAEIVGALGTMHPRTRRAAGKFLIATLIAVFPANVYMAMNVGDFPSIPGGTATLLARLPLQALFVYWVWLATLSPEAEAATAGTEDRSRRSSAST